MPANVQGKSATILNVDANDANRLAVTQALREAGFQLCEATTAAAALTAAAKGPDLIVLELRLPDAGGADLCRRLKADPVTAPIPVLLLSGECSDSRCRVACFEAGAEACLARPVAADELVAQARTLIRLRRAEQQVRERAEEVEKLLEHRLRAISDNLPNGAVYQVLADADGHRQFLYLSAGLERMLGVPMAEALADAGALYGLVHEEDRARVAAQEAVALRELAAYDCEFRSWTRSGALRWLHCRSAPRRIAGGETIWEGIVMDVTDRRHAEMEVRRLNGELQERVNELQTLLDILPIGVWQADPECQRIIGNHAAYAMLGLPHGVNASVTAPELRAGARPGFRCLVDGREVPPDELPMQRVARTGQPVRNAAHDVVLDNGTTRTVLCNVAPVLDTDGRVRAVLGAYADITDRKQAETALRASEARLAVELEAMRRLHELGTRLLAAPDLCTALEEILDAAITMSRAHLGSVQLYDDATQALTIVAHRGFGPGFLEHFRTVRADSGSACGRAMRGERVIIVDVQADPDFAPHRQVAAAAGYRAVHSMPLLSRGGKLLGILSTHFRQPHRPSEHDLRILDLYARQAADMIARIRADEALHRASERLTSLVDHTPLAVVEWDKDFHITRWSGEAEKVFGWPAAEMVGRPINTAGIVYEEDWSKVHDTMARLLDGKNRYVISANRNWTSDGRAIDCEWYSSILSDEAGHMEAVLSLVLDVTDRKRAEMELREADKRKDEFLATLAHELRNPLAPIRNAVQILKMDGSIDPRMAWARGVIDRQVEQMARLLDDLLDVSRITRSKLELRKEHVELAAIVQSALETSRPHITEMGHELTIALPQQPIIVEADLFRLAQVFLNLLTNAAKYTDAGGRIWLTAERQGSDVVVSVKDTGIGIRADQMPHIFEMFTQLSQSPERSKGGLGIGLSLVKRLVEMHGGSIEAHSAGPGQGSEFMVRLPVAMEASRPLPASATNDDPPARSLLRILIVDDNRDGADSLSMMLRIRGNDTRTAYDGEEALTAAEQFRPDVILLDIGLPRLSGYETCRHIREQPWGKRIVIIAQTGWGQDEDRRRTHKAGFDHHIVKPVDPNALLRLLGTLQTT